MMSSDNIVVVRDISKDFGRVRVLDRVDIEVHEGEFFGILGPSGCGKTTLLRILAGFESATKGDVFVGGQLMNTIPPDRRPVNMVFQNYAIFPHLNVRQNLAYGLRRGRLTKDEIERKVTDALARIKLEGFGDRRPGQLSGGERQRVALARALIIQPKVLLLDEPLGALDRKLREQMQIELRALQQEIGITFLFVTHDQDEALSMSDRIAVIAGGRVLQIDTPERLYERPSSRMVADFIGTMNILHGHVRERSDDVVAIETLALGVIPCLSDLQLRVGDHALIAIRPEKIVATRDAPVGEQIVVSGIVTATAYLGDRSHLQVRIAGLDKPLLVAGQNVSQLEHGAHAGEGEAIWLSWRRESMVVLPVE